MPYVIAASLKVKKKHLGDFTKRVKRHANNCVTKEPGCLSFEVSIDRADQRRFLFYEIYLDEATFAAHAEAPHMKKQIDATAHMIDGKIELFGFWDRLAAPNK